MDEAYKQHANQARRKNRSTTNLNHLSLAPFTSKLPLSDADDLPDFLATPPHPNTSYLQGKSAPTTPRLLSHSPLSSGRSRSHPRKPSAASSLPKSKSASHLTLRSSRRASSGTASPNNHRQHDDASFKAGDGDDGDWLLRCGALISSETRESKGQSWLLSRASSTSLTGLQDAEEDAFERELARERSIASRTQSRCGSVVVADDDLSPPTSRFGSRSQSRAGSRSQLMTPHERHTSDDGYFRYHGTDASHIPGPDFVNLDEKLEAIEPDTTQEDEAALRRLVKHGNAGAGSWVGAFFGWTLFSVEENDEESDADGDTATDGETEEEMLKSRKLSARHFEGSSTLPEEMNPPKADEGGWQDAAWLLSVASKVII